MTVYMYGYLLKPHINQVLKCPSQPHLWFWLDMTVWLVVIFYSEHVKTKEITLKLTYQEIVRQAFRNATYTKSNQDFASPNNINNINGIKNGRG